jgi:hypothetical protein
MPKKTSKNQPTKVAFHARLDPEILDRARDAAYWTPGLNLSRLVEVALVHEIARLEKSRGTPFPKRRGPLPTGRPIKT